jgi:ribosomal protein S6--L-glutamate ligase
VEDRFILGWEEWLSLPDLGLPTIKAKVDTGAKTSSLHAYFVEPFGTAARPMVRFGVHPIPGRDDVQIVCTAEVIDRREVTSSNGERETRYVIRSNVSMGSRTWPIEITLANRETMTYRMLLGRQAIADDMIVDPTSSFRQPRLGYKIYGARVRTAEDRRALRVALLTRQPDGASNRRLLRAIEARGHSSLIIDRSRVSLLVDSAEPAIFVDGRALEPVDAVIVRGGKTLSTFSAAIVRQLELLGARALNSADALLRAGDPLSMRQTLARAGIRVPETAVSHVSKGPSRSEGHILADDLDTSGRSALLRFATVGGRAVAAMARDAATRSSLETEGENWHRYEGSAVEPARHLAEDAARALHLGLASIDVMETRQGPVIADVTPTAPISLFERITGAALAEAVVVEIEQQTRIPAARIPVARTE